MENNNASTGGISFCGLLTIVFIVLKLTDYIDWSWWWVLSPLWLPITVVLGVILVPLLLLGGLHKIANKITNKKGK